MFNMQCRLSGCVSVFGDFSLRSMMVVRNEMIIPKGCFTNILLLGASNSVIPNWIYESNWHQYFNSSSSHLGMTLASKVQATKTSM